MKKIIIGFQTASPTLERGIKMGGVLAAFSGVFIFIFIIKIVFCCRTQCLFPLINLEKFASSSIEFLRQFSFLSTEEIRLQSIRIIKNIVFYHLRVMAKVSITNILPSRISNWISQ